MYSPLPKVEIIFYFVICIFVMWYFLLHVYLSGNAFVKYLGSDESIVPGWPILPRLRDTSDDEWMAWRSYMAQVLPWLISHVLFSQVCRYFCVYAVPLSHVWITLMFITFNLDLNVAILFIVYLNIFYFIALLRSKLLVWFVGIILLLCNAYDVFNVRSSLDFHESFLTEVSFSWFILKSIDYSLFNIGHYQSVKMFLDFAAYAFYLPTFFFGPFVPYEEFFKGLHKPFESWTFSRCKSFVLDALRFCMWALLIEISSHYLYCNALHYHLYSIIFSNLWTLNGIGFCLAQFFYLKYLVFYGLAGCLAKLEGYDSPPPPKCVNRIHLYSKMWRYFDRGYYLFTINCIYKPVCLTPSCSTRRKFFASTLSFCFVLLWHGLTYTIFYWSLFNFVGVTLEAVGKYLCSTSFYGQFVVLCKTQQNVRRISCLLASPLWVLAVISNYLFFGGHKYGFKCFEQFLTGDWKLILFTFLVAYAMCQISVEVENFEFFKYKRRKNHKTNESTKVE